MRVKLKVIGGKNDGREIDIKVPEFVIGRGEEAHLRPNNELVSRRHCAIRIDSGKVIVEDLGSSNGTFINGEQLAESREVRVGDILRVGRLQFQVLMDPVQPGAKRPKVKGVVEAAARAASAPEDELDEESISVWLSDIDYATETLSGPMQDTRQFAIDESQTRMFTKSDQLADDKVKAEESGSGDQEKPGTNGESGSGYFRRKKREVKKLPPRPKYSSETTTTAADEVLRKFFNRR